MTGRVNHEYHDQADEAEKRALSLFSTERQEDYMAMLAVAVVLTLIMLFTLS